MAVWIDDYNTVRRHSTTGMLSPIDYERAHAAIQPAADMAPALPDQGVA